MATYFAEYENLKPDPKSRNPGPARLKTADNMNFMIKRNSRN